LFLSSRKYDPGCSSRIRILIFLFIPDPGAKKAQDPGLGSATLLKINFNEGNLCLESRSIHKSSVTIVTGVSADLQVGLHVASQLVLALKHFPTARTGKGSLHPFRVGELMLTQGRRLHEGLAAEPADLLAARGAGGVLQAVALQLVLGEGHKVAGLAYRIPDGVWVGLTSDRRGFTGGENRMRNVGTRFLAAGDFDADSNTYELLAKIFIVVCHENIRRCGSGSVRPLK
jgi:hypothetical protein